MEKTWSDLTPYEVERQRTIEANNKKLEALNIPRLSQSIQKSSSTKVKVSFSSFSFSFNFCFAITFMLLVS
jgi:hypothetical protein